MDYFRRFFGFGDRNDRFDRFFDRDPEFSHSDGMNKHHSFFDNSDMPNEDFNFFDDPSKMQSYFEKQMSDIMKMFGFPGFGSFDNFFQDFNSPLEEHHSSYYSNDFQDNPSGNLRDQFIKNGYEKPSQHLHDDRKDKDLDDKIKDGSLNSILDERGTSQSIFPYGQTPIKKYMYGKSVSHKTITNPDGSVETHRTVRDNDGNEETTICRKIGEKEYCIIKKRDKFGKEEVTENLINMDEKDKDLFLKPYLGKPKGDDSPSDSFPFDKFFK